MANKPLCKMNNVGKCFGDVVVLKDISFSVSKGTIHALIGENGAGKSTLINIIGGIYPDGQYTGQIEFDGKLQHFKGITESEDAGIAIIHQELALVPQLSLAENMFLGHERTRGFGIDWKETYNMAKKYLLQVGLDESPDTLVQDIGVGKQQLLEIAKALAKNSKLLILDEPTAPLNDNESKNLLDLMLKLKQDGLTCIIISHKLKEIEYVADSCTVIRDGLVVDDINIAKEGFSEDRITKAMVGRELTDRFPKRKSKVGKVNFSVEDWTVYHPLYTSQKVVDSASINAKSGEIVGLAGLVGAGRTELAMSIFGESYGKKTSGKLCINGQEKNICSVKDAVANKLIYVTEDRKVNGLILEKEIGFNTTLADLGKLCRGLVVNDDEEFKVTKNYIKQFKIKCQGPYENVGNLSGGNQQKVLLSKSMFADPEILILDEPTRGIDVGAKYDIYCIINELASQGKTVIIISSELEEIFGMTDRVYVMNEGRIIGDYITADINQETIMNAIVKDNDKRSSVDAA